jgi:hypothetical protein
VGALGHASVIHVPERPSAQLAGPILGALITLAGAALGWYVSVETRFDRIEAKIQALTCAVRPGAAGCLPPQEEHANADP